MARSREQAEVHLLVDALGLPPPHVQISVVVTIAHTETPSSTGRRLSGGLCIVRMQARLCFARNVA
jgi:hypothetical protein